MIKELVAIASAGLVAAAAQASSFVYTGVFLDDKAVVMTFDGTLSGNLITGITKVTVNYGGFQMVGDPANGGYLYNISYDPPNSPNGWYKNGGAVVSLDGNQDNFWFMDTTYPSETYTNYFEHVNPLGAPVEAYRAGHGGSDYLKSHSVEQVESPAVPEPASWALMLVGFGAIGGALRGSRRRASIAFG